MAICQICGCKTDDIDFVESSVNGLKTQACSFCGKQLAAFTSEEVSDAHVKWIKTIADKEVETRSEELKFAIDGLLEKYGEKSSLPSFNPNSTAFNTASKKTEQFSDAASNNAIAELTKRVEMLETELKIYRVKQIRKTITELFACLIIAIIMLIIFFTSDFYSGLEMFFT